MLIEVQCRNFSKFDARRGTYVECKERMYVTDDQQGQIVVCKKCKQPIEVPIGEHEAQRGARTPVESSANKPARQGKGDGPNLRLSQPLTRPKSDVMSLDFGGQEIYSTVLEDRNERCRKCGNLSEDGRCTVCRYVESKFKTLHQPLDEITIELSGFQRWFSKTMSEGVSVKYLEYGSHALMGVFGLSLAIASLVCMAWSILGGLFLLFITVSISLLYIGLVYQGHQFLRDPRARLAWFQKPFWILVLRFSRMMNWQAYDGRLKGRKIITERDPGFGDRDLASLDGLKACQVLDLEGTNVTDRGLQELYSLKHLQCVVLRGTKVSPESVFRLQQSFPRLWIWD